MFDSLGPIKSGMPEVANAIVDAGPEYWDNTFPIDSF